MGAYDFSLNMFFELNCILFMAKCICSKSQIKLSSGLLSPSVSVDRNYEYCGGLYIFNVHPHSAGSPMGHNKNFHH